MLPSIRLELQSQHLGESRALHIICGDRFRRRGRRYALFCADGQMLNELLAPMPSRVLETCLFVGIESNPETRDYDYIRGYCPDRFDAHERFVTDEAVGRINREFCLDDSGCTRGLCGFSNGATLAHVLAVRNPGTFCFAFVFSAADNRVRQDEYPDEHRTRYYLAAGTREPDYLRATRSIADDLQAIQANYTFAERDADHSIGFWANELRVAMEWILEA